MTPRRNTLLLVGMTFAILVLAFSQNPTVAGHRMVRFTSGQEIQRFLVGKSLYRGAEQEDEYYGGIQTLSANSNRVPGSLTSETSSLPSHSETNNQVQGVDELDTVKTDGHYIYTVSGSRVLILKAYPASEARVAYEIQINGTVIGASTFGAL